MWFEDLKKLLEKLPGVGPRQAGRFIWALLDFSGDEQQKLSKAIAELSKHLKRCGTCFRAFSPPLNPLLSKEGRGGTCSFCLPTSKRDHTKIMVVEKDNDLLNIEKSGAYGGFYHVLGGMIDPLDENPIVRERIKKLYERISCSSPPEADPHLAETDVFPREIILALSPTKMGEFTSNYIIKILEPITKPQNLKISRLARGLATGTDLEYADELTLRQALDNRK